MSFTEKNASRNYSKFLQFIRNSNKLLRHIHILQWPAYRWSIHWNHSTSSLQTSHDLIMDSKLFKLPQDIYYALGKPITLVLFKIGLVPFVIPTFIELAVQYLTAIFFFYAHCEEILNVYSEVCILKILFKILRWN